MRPLVFALLVALAVAVTVPARAQTGRDRLPAAVLDVRPPSARVSGEPGLMRIRQAPCATTPRADVRKRIVDTAVQEWGFFGFTVVDQREADQEDEHAEPRRRRRLPRDVAARVASTIAGYWAVTASGAWILEEQNRVWRGDDGVGARWRYPWSAAFISWVMCESGLGQSAVFERAVAHHVYIDQAIRARNGGAPGAAYAAYERGETPVAPGDLLCSSRRPVYRTLAERRRQMGAGARTHCDIVVKVDTEGERIYAIGGNVRGLVSLKVLPLAALDPATPPLSGTRPIFAHLKLRAAPVAATVFDDSPMMRALGCPEAASSQRVTRPAACSLSLD